MKNVFGHFTSNCLQARKGVEGEGPFDWQASNKMLNSMRNSSATDEIINGFVSLHGLDDECQGPGYRVNAVGTARNFVFIF